MSKSMVACRENFKALVAIPALLLALGSFGGCSSDTQSAVTPTTSVAAIALHLVDRASMLPGAVDAKGFMPTIADLNGDAALDIVQPTVSGLRVWWNRGAGKYEQSTDSIFKVSKGYAVQAIVADFNDDKVADLFVAMAGGHASRLLLGKGGGTFEDSTAPSSSTADSGYALAVDFDGDLDIDVI